MIKRLLTAFMGLLFMVTAANAAFISVREQKDYRETYSVLTYEGGIDWPSASQLYKSYNLYKPKVIEFNSPGGLLEAGIGMANFLQDKDVTLVVNKRSYCVSACFLILVSKEDIVVDGLAAAHMPFIPRVGTGARIIDVGRHFGIGYTMITKEFLKYGFNIHFILEMAKESNETEFIVFDSAEKINFYRHKPDQSYFPRQWVKMTGAEILKTVSVPITIQDEIGVQ